MLNDFEKIVTFSRGMIKHRLLNHLFGDRLCFAPLDYGQTPCIIGWGNKANTSRARKIAATQQIPFFSVEDGFIRSVGLGSKGSPSFSVVIDDLGIYYDATKPSRLERILSEYDFDADAQLQEKAEQAINLIKAFKISKYNAADDALPAELSTNPARKKILIIAQTRGDMSLKFGFGDQFSTNQIIDTATRENPNCDIFLKIHPDVLAGKKQSDLNLDQIPAHCRVITENTNPLALLEKVDRVYTKTSQMGFEALLLGKECICFGAPFYAGWGLTDDRIGCNRRGRKLSVLQVFAGAYILYAHYYNPYLNRKSDIIDTLYTLKKYREIDRVNSSTLCCYGFPAEKKAHCSSFFKSTQPTKLISCKIRKTAARLTLKTSKLLIWGATEDTDLQDRIRSNSITTYHVEDGFLQALPLSSGLTTTSSLVVDSKGLYLDPSSESDLESIYNTYNFKAHTGLLERAGNIADALKIKVSQNPLTPYHRLPVPRHSHDRIILIPGQNPDEASLRLAGAGMDNLSLMKTVRSNNPHAFLIYMPHPDTVSALKQGSLPENIIREYCDDIIARNVIETSMDEVDEVHTITSLFGFSAILYDKKVYTYGIPFYAGWGLTIDAQSCPRRLKILSKEELIAGALLVYPRYVHPETKQYCELEQLLPEMQRGHDGRGRSTLHRKVRNMSDIFRLFPKRPSAR